MRRLLAVAIVALGIGYLIGDRPDRQLRTEAELLADRTERLAGSCRLVLSDNLRHDRWHAARDHALVEPAPSWLPGAGG